jgi:Protein of unknown function (DUF1207)
MSFGTLPHINRPGEPIFPMEADMIHRLKKQTTRFWILALFGLWQFSVLTVQAEQPHDEFIRGYVTALVAMNYPGSVKSITVDGGVVYIQTESLSEEEKTELRKMLSDVEGVLRVEFAAESEIPVAPGVPPKEFKEPVEPGEHLPTLLPKSPLFQPLLADPRWPHFSASFQRYIDTDQLKDVAATNFGESIGLYRLRGPLESTIQLDIQAGVFSIFDLDSQSFDLINADYLVGIPLTIKKNNFANMTRVFHQSSHLGDEYLLRGNSDERINLSYESVNSLLSYHLPAGLRIYAGGGYIFHKDPSDLDPWSTQAGLEFRSPFFWLKGALRPVAAVDVQNRQESNWNTDVSARAGIQFENPDFLSRKLQLLLEYYNGKSPNGQFYEGNIEFFGLGLHFFLD